MSKHSISTRETQVDIGNTVGKQVEQTVSVDDLSLPTAQELEAYQKINPNIVEFLLETSRKEQELVGHVFCLSFIGCLDGSLRFCALP